MDVWGSVGMQTQAQCTADTCDMQTSQQANCCCPNVQMRLVFRLRSRLASCPLRMCALTYSLRLMQ